MCLAKAASSQRWVALLHQAAQLGLAVLGVESELGKAEPGEERGFWAAGPPHYPAQLPFSPNRLRSGETAAPRVQVAEGFARATTGSAPTRLSVPANQ